MADIKYLYGNPIKDGFAVHFPVSADAPVYPSKKSNVTIDTDGTMGYGSADETILITGTDVFFLHQDTSTQAREHGLTAEHVQHLLTR